MSDAEHDQNLDLGRLHFYIYMWEGVHFLPQWMAPHLQKVQSRFAFMVPAHFDITVPFTHLTQHPSRRVAPFWRKCGDAEEVSLRTTPTCDPKRSKIRNILETSNFNT